MCSIPVTVRPRLCTICTAVAPDPVGTFRMNDVTGQGYRLVTPTTTNPLANPSTSPKNPEDGTSQGGRHHEAVENLAAARLTDAVDLVLADAKQVLTDTPSGSVDLLFLDADRNAYVDYWPELLRVLRPGGLLAVDNCISHAGEVAEFSALVRSTNNVEAVLVPIGAGLLLVTIADPG